MRKDHYQRARDHACMRQNLVDPIPKNRRVTCNVCQPKATNIIESTLAKHYATEHPGVTKWDVTIDTDEVSYLERILAEKRAYHEQLA